MNVKSGYPFVLKDAGFVDTKKRDKTIEFTLTPATASKIISMEGYAGCYITANAYGGSGTTTVEVKGSDDLAYYDYLNLLAIGDMVSPRSGRLRLSNFNASRGYFPKQSKFAKFSLSGLAYTTTISLTLTDSPLFIPPELSNTFYPGNNWSYISPTGGITTTAVTTLVSAYDSGSPPFKRQLSKLIMSNSGTSGTEFLIKDTSSTPVEVYRDYIGPGGRISESLDNAASSSGRGLAIELLSGVNVAVYCNISGFTVGAV